MGERRSGRGRGLPVWQDRADRAWADRVRWRLAWHHRVPADVAGPALVEAHGACRTTGAAAAELFGDPDTHAERIARERSSPERRAEADLQGASHRDRWRLLPLAVGWSGAVSSAVLLVDRGWWVDVGPAGLVVAGGVGSAVVAAALALAERRTGELRRSRRWWVVTAALPLAAGTAAPGLSGRPALVEVPLLVTLLLSVALLGLGLRLLARAPAPDLGPRQETPEQWFTRLGGVLRGRHLLPRAEVRRRVDAARESWRSGDGEHPSLDLGAPEVHALRLVDGSPLPERSRRRSEAWVMTALTAFATWTVVERAVDGELERELLWLAPLAAVMVWCTASLWRRTGAGTEAGDAPEERPDGASRA